MNIQAWIDAQVDIIKNCADCLDEMKERPDALIIQLWAHKKHVDATLDFLERNRRYGLFKEAK